MVAPTHSSPAAATLHCRPPRAIGSQTHFQGVLLRSGKTQMVGRWPTARSRPCLRSRRALGWLPPPNHAGPQRVGPSKLRNEISAGLGLDSDLPRQHAVSLRSARVAGARHPLSGMSPSERRLSRFSLFHLLSRTATGRTEADRSLPSAS